MYTIKRNVNDRQSVQKYFELLIFENSTRFGRGTRVIERNVK